MTAAQVMVPQQAQYRHIRARGYPYWPGVGSLWPNAGMPVLARFFADVQELIFTQP